MGSAIACSQNSTCAKENRGGGKDNRHAEATRPLPKAIRGAGYHGDHAKEADPLGVQ